MKYTKEIINNNPSKALEELIILSDNNPALCKSMTIEYLNYRLVGLRPYTALQNIIYKQRCKYEK